MRRFTLYVVLALGVPAVLAAQDSLPLNRKVDSIVAQVVAAKEFSGTILIRRGNRTLARTSYGLASRELGVPNRNDTRYLIGSIAKQFTAAAILLLEEQGKLKISDPLAMYVPGFPSGDKITLLQMLTHSSGISRDLPDAASTMVMSHTPAEMVELIKRDTLLYAPGTSHAYSNNAYRVLAFIIEQVSGMPYARFLHDSFFQPLGMANTGQLEERSFVAKLASGYTPGFGPDGFGLAGHLDLSNAVGPGSLYSTVDDLYRWSSEFLMKGVLYPAVSRRMTSGRGIGTVADTVAGGRRIIWHDGVYQGYTALLETFPGDTLTIVYLGNTETASSQSALQAALTTVALTGRVEVLNAPPVAPSPPMDLAREYVGTYRFTFGLRIALALRDGRLVLEGLPLECSARDACYYRLKGSQVNFTRDASGQVNGMSWVDPGGTYPAEKESR